MGRRIQRHKAAAKRAMARGRRYLRKVPGVKRIARVRRHHREIKMEGRLSSFSAWVAQFLYCTRFGRKMLKGASSRKSANIAGGFLDTKYSKFLIKPFIRRHQVRLSDYKKQEFSSYNDFFTRQIRPELRPMPEEPETLASPCDSRLSVYAIEEGTVLPIKHSCYTVEDLLGGDRIADRFMDGLCLVFRLCVDDYHRYCYPDAGTKGKNTFLPGRLHTVAPVALSRMPVFVQNCREYTVLETEHFGTVVQVEVGALMVGRIRNHHEACSFQRGQEKGYFQYGGSTIVLLLEKDRLCLTEEVREGTAEGRELQVRMGQAIGTPVKKPGDGC